MNLITLLLNIYGYHLLLSESLCVRARARVCVWVCGHVCVPGKDSSFERELISQYGVFSSGVPLYMC